MDIREILAALDPADRILWSQHRTEMRRSYLNAHNTTVGMAAWNDTDDALLDLLDIKLALLFDRAGRFAAVKDVIGKEDAKSIEEVINLKGDGLKIAQAEMSSASKMLTNGWGAKQ